MYCTVIAVVSLTTTTTSKVDYTPSTIRLRIRLQDYNGKSGMLQLDYVYSTTLLPWLFVVNCIYCSLRVPVLDTVFLCFCFYVLVLSLILTSGHLVILSSAVVASALIMSFHSRARYHVIPALLVCSRVNSFDLLTYYCYLTHSSFL
jgi:hypothetical protein